MQKHGKSAEIRLILQLVEAEAMQAAGEKSFCFEGHILDLRRGCLRRDDREIELRPKSFELLRYLVENAGRLVPKDELIKSVWPNVTVTDESLARCVSDVRLALNDSEQHIIKTMLRRGYLFAAPVWVAAQEGSPAGPIGPAGVIGHDGNALELKSGMRASAPRFSLVVLPFSNLSGDPAQDHVADVITEGLTTYLSRIRDSFVIARGTASAYKDKATDLRQIGQALGVRYVLSGSEHHSGARVRVSAQLIDVDTGAHLWADQFDADRVDLLQMQDDIVTRLARALQIELAAVEAARIPREQGASQSAEDLALHGEAIFLRYGPSRDESEAAFDLCERALKLNPNNVRALCILAEKFGTRVTGMQSIDRESDVRRADELASRALAVEPNSYHAHHAKARILIGQKRAEEAMIEAERSLRLNPSFIPTYLALCQANLMSGHPEKSIEYANRAMRLSPPDPYLYVFYAQEGLARIVLREDERAVACLRRAVANNPEFPTPVANLAAMLALTGQEAEARETLKEYLSLRGARTRTIAAWRAMAYSDNPIYLASRERIYEGLRKAGMPEE
jgi:TolB-like protein/DNA-binding winged helix-turn-helix (wHTH) protein/cytochrome c-type biogenesis protein CcmH/NrfG